MSVSNGSAIVAVHLHQLVNVDLLQRGFYSISLRLYRKKRRVGKSNQRIDGTVSMSPQLPHVDAAARNKCSLEHSICNWRCRPFRKAAKRQTATTIKTKNFYIEYQRTKELLNCTAIFNIDCPNTTDARAQQEDCLYLEFELLNSGDRYSIYT